MKKKLLFSLCIVVSCVLKVKSQSGNNMVFNGTSNYIRVSDHNDLDIGSGENYTITCWIKTTQWKNMPVFRKRDPSGVGYEMTVGSGGAYAINMRSTTNVNAGSTVASYNMNLNQWYHLAMVVDIVDKSTKTYVNGVLQGTTTNANIGTLSFENSVDVTIGHSVDQNRFFLGQMDDVRVWSKAFTSTELLADMTTTSVSSATPNLLAAWDFENVTGNTVPDVSGNGHAGTITGTVPLPVSFISFTGVANGNSVKLKWSTSSEKDNAYFEIERSADGIYFSVISKVNGAINSDEKRDYVVIDYAPVAGANYYRLKQVDLNGASTYFDVVLSIPVLKTASLNLYPNPAKEFIVVNVPETQDLKLEVFGLNGVKQKTPFDIREGQIKVNTSGLKQGMYILKASNRGKAVSVQKFIIN